MRGYVFAGVAFASVSAAALIYNAGRTAGRDAQVAEYASSLADLRSERDAALALRDASQREAERLRAESSREFNEALDDVFRRALEAIDVSPDPTVPCLERVYSVDGLRQQANAGIAARAAAAVRRGGGAADTAAGPLSTDGAPDGDGPSQPD